MSYEDKIQSARELIDSHNSSENLPENKKIDFEEFLKYLQSDGGTTEAALKMCSWEDLVGYWPGKLPRLLSRMIAEVFRKSSEEKDKEGTSWAVSPRKAEKLTPAQLVVAFDPNEADSHVGARLKTLSNNQPFLVFTSDGSVDTVSSVILLDEIRKGWKPREFYEDGGIVTGVYAVGDGPSRLADQNPLWTQEILRPDGTCSQTGRSWKPVQLVVRQIIFLARQKTSEIVINSVQDAHNIIDMAISDNADTKLCQRCPKASKLFEELRQTGSIPSLRVPLNGSKQGKSNDPFFSSGHRSY